MSDDAFVIVIGALLGAGIGSFLNVCILRLPKNESIVRPPSHCPRCGVGISWYDNIPVLSWLILRGRCRKCGNPISMQYPLIELVTAGLWAGMAGHYGMDLEALRGAVFLTLLLGIALTDAREYIIPDEFSLGGGIIGLVFSAAQGIKGLWPALLGAGVGFVTLLLVAEVGKRAFKRDAMGGAISR